MLVCIKMVGKHVQKTYKDELKLMTEQLIAMKKWKEVVDNFKAWTFARAEKKDAAKAKRKAKKKAKRQAKRKAEAIAKAARKTDTNVDI